MEEQKNSMQVSFLLRSGQLEHIQVNLFDSSDLPISTFLVDNYNYRSILLGRRINHFYCILIEKGQQIEDHMEVKINREGEGQKGQHNLMNFQKKFGSYLISIRVQYLKVEKGSSSSSENFAKQEAEITKMANFYLKKMQKNAIKRMQVQELKKPIQPRQKNGDNKQNLRNFKGSLTILTNRKTDKIKSKWQKHQIQSGIQEKEQIRSKRIRYDKQSEDSEISLMNEKQSKVQIKKSNTLFLCQNVKNDEQTVKQIKLVQKQNPSIYDLMLKAFDQSKKFNKQGKIRVKRVSKKAFHSHNNSLVDSTLEDIQKQKIAFQLIGSIKNSYTHRTPKIPDKMQKNIKLIKRRKNPTSNIDLINTKRLLMK